MKSTVLWSLTAVALIAGAGCAPDAPPAMEATAPPGAPEIAAPPKPRFDASAFAMAIDPVCRMSLEEYEAVETADHEGKTYGFCANLCARKFREDPGAILKRFEVEPSS